MLWMLCCCGGVWRSPNAHRAARWPPHRSTRLVPSLRSGGRLAIVFSNRLFFSKAIALWTGKDDLEHVYTVGAYVHYGARGALSDPEAVDLTPRSSKKGGDPLYAVVATRQS